MEHGIQYTSTKTAAASLEFTLQRAFRPNKLKLELPLPPGFTVRLAAMGNGVNFPAAFNKARSFAASTFTTVASIKPAPV